MCDISPHYKILGVMIMYMLTYFRNSNENTNWNKVFLWTIPIFWPILIVRMFLSGKTYKPTMNMNVSSF